jgi:uncharacterized protein
MLTSAALAAIKGYQRYMSPYKGFCCAYRVHTGKAGCSQFGYRAISRFGIFDGLSVLKKRLALCGQVYRQCAQKVSNGAKKVISKAQRPHYKQRGDCDPGCAGDCSPDIGFGDVGDAVGSVFDCCGSCDWKSSRSSKQARKYRAGRYE